jgi:hypothetical protein
VTILCSFLTAKEYMGIVEDTRRYKGLELEFDLDITDDAEVGGDIRS